MKKKKRIELEYSNFNSKDETKRFNRIIGQIEGVRKMLDERRKLADVLMQCKAIHSALRAIESRIVKAHLEVALEEITKMDKKKDRAERVSDLEDLYRYAE